ncbi:MAG: universal stress protein [Planctomycetota bacterium]
MFASILVLLDTSAAAASALQLGVAIATKANATLRGLHVEDERRFLYFPPINAMSAALGAAPTIPVPLPAAELARIEEAVGAETDHLRASFGPATAALPAVRASFSAVRGDIVEEMIDASHRHDLVLLGCRRASGGGDGTDPGNRIESLLRESNRPVILVPAGASPDLSHIVMAYDASDTARRALRECASLARTLGASLDVITVARSDDEAAPAMDEARDYLAPWGLTSNIHRLAGKAREQIVAHAASTKAGLLAMGAFGHNRVSEFLFGSATRHVLEHLPCAVLLARF